MKIAIIFDADQQGGGGFYQSLRTIDLILKDKESVNLMLLSQITRLKKFYQF